MELSEKLKAARISNKLTQKTLAARLGVSRATLCLWESGKSVPAILYLREYQKIFGFEKGYFDEAKKASPSKGLVSFDVSQLTADGKQKLTDFYNSLIRTEEYLKKP